MAAHLGSLRADVGRRPGGRPSRLRREHGRRPAIQRLRPGDDVTTGRGHVPAPAGPGRTRPGSPGRGHGRCHRGRGIADVRRDHLLHRDRRLFGDLRPGTCQAVDDRSHPLVRVPARPGPLSGELPGPSMRAHATRGSLDRSIGGRAAGVRSPLRPDQVGHARLGVLPARRAAATTWRVHRSRGELPQGTRGRSPARTRPGAAPLGAGTHRPRDRDAAPCVERDAGADLPLSSSFPRTSRR